MGADSSATWAPPRRPLEDDGKGKNMFQIRRTLQTTPSQAPSAIEWWERSHGTDALAEQITRLRRQLALAIADAGRSSRPVFLRALGRDIEAELQQLDGRVAFGVGEQASGLRERCRTLEEMVGYYCDVVVPSKRAFDVIELSDCAREAVAGLSGDMHLVLRIEGEPCVIASRRLATALFEVAILAASAGPTDEIEVILLSCSEVFAEFRVASPKVIASTGAALGFDRDKSRFLALAVAYALQIGATLSRSTLAEEVLIVRFPIGTRARYEGSTVPSLDPGVIAEATAFCAEG